MAEESKIVEPIDGDGADKSHTTGKQPAVDSGDDASDHDDETQAAGAAGSASAPKKKSKRKKVKNALSGKSADPEADMKKAIASLPPDQLAEFMKLNPALAQELATKGGGSGSDGLNIEALKQLRLQDIMTGLASSGKNVKDMASYKFWQTQPVPKFGDEVPKGPIEEGPIKIQSIDEIPTEPQKMMDGFEWDTVDLSKPDQLKEVYELLNGHYVEDTEAMFRFKYSQSILKWAMLPPGWVPEWYAGVRATQSKKLVAFISAIPVELRIRNKTVHASEVNFMVIHKKLRSKRLAPVLIKEITRRCNLKEVWQAIYTGGTVLPKPVSTCRYFHRAINWQKLYEVGFSPLPHGSKPQFQVRKYALPDNTTTKGLREMTANDTDAVLPLFTKYLKRYDLAQEFSKEEFEHWMLDKKDVGDEQVIFSYVVEDENKNITDFMSFNVLDSSVIDNAKHQVIKAAYLFYYATDVGLATPLDKGALKTRLNALIMDLMILAKRQRCDVFNGLSIMDNALFLEQQKFGKGDGQLHYYLFNYRANPIAGGVDRKNELDDVGLSGIGLPML